MSLPLTFLVLGALLLKGCAPWPLFGTPVDRSIVATPADLAYAERLWDRLVEADYVGPHVPAREPYVAGGIGHGEVIEVDHGRVRLGGHEGLMVLKKNYHGNPVTPEAVQKDRQRYLESVFVMYRREPGYDPDNQDWFWVKYTPDGEVFEEPFEGGEILPRAGRLVKRPADSDGPDGGCLFCHASAAGGDYIFAPSIRP